VSRNEVVQLGVFRGSVGELVHTEWGFCCMRRYLWTGCQDPVEVRTGSLLLSVAVVSDTIRVLVVVVHTTPEREWPLCLVLCALLGVVPTEAEGML